MSINTTWSVNTLERELETGRVTVVHYNVASSDGTYSASAYGSIGLSGEVTTPYSELSPEQVCGWVRDALNAEDEGATDRIVESLANNIDKQRNPITGTGTPW